MADRRYIPMLLSLGALLFANPSACSVAHEGPQEGTETGNPPVINEKLIALLVQGETVQVTGAPGAVSPGGAPLEVTSSLSGEIFRGRAAQNGSFEIAVTTGPLDTFEVRAVAGTRSSNAVYVVRGAAAVTSGSDDGLSCRQRDDLARAQMGAVAQAADTRCTSDVDCVAVSRTTLCSDGCNDIALSKEGQRELDDARRAIEGGLCKDFTADGCSLLHLPCPGPVPGAAPRCVSGECMMASTQDDAGPLNAGSQTDAGVSAVSSISGTLISQLGTSEADAIVIPHEIELLNADTGEPFSPPIVTLSATGTGKYAFAGVPQGVNLALHVKGVGPLERAGSTYDAFSYYAPKAGDNFLRVGTASTADVASGTGAFQRMPDRAPVSGAVYLVDASDKRIGAVGCAQLFLDDQPHPALDAAQRYELATRFPTTLDKQVMTLAGLGRFYFGNVAPGAHVLKVSMDGGRTFLAEKSFFVPFARKDASAAYKEILYFVGIDISGPDPTPAGCPAD